MPTPAPSPRDLHADVTRELIAAIERGPGTFVMPWHMDSARLRLPINALTGKAYSGINILSLWIAAQQSNFTHPIWATYRQWAERGAQVLKGERAVTVVFYKEHEVEPDPNDPKDTGRRRLARASHVFNAEQVAGYLPATPSVPITTNGQLERLEEVDRFIETTEAKIRYSGDRAYYDPKSDLIQIPAPECFMGTTTSTVTESFYSVAFHELVHWSGARHRLDREFGERFGDHAYCAEELVAELGAAFLCAEFGITNVPRPDHAQYLTHWLGLLQQDSRAIFVAAARAAEAVRFLRSVDKPQDQIIGSPR